MVTPKLYQTVLWSTAQGVDATHCSRPWKRSDAVVPDPLGVGMRHSGLLHVLALGEDLFHSC